MTQTEIQQYVYDFLYDKSLPHQTIVAIMGNITGESGWDVTCIEQGTGVGFGLCQWSYGRRTELENYGTDLEHQCEFLWSELTGENTDITGASCQWISNPANSVTPDTSYQFSLQDFLDGNGTVAELTTAWCYCWERPAYATNHLDRRIASAESFNTSMSYQGSVTTGAITSEQVNSAVDWAIDIANNDIHGYDQTNRQGPDYDCSSLLINAWVNAGVDVLSAGASYTGDMIPAFESCGFIKYNIQDVANKQRGDILWVNGHVAMMISNTELVEASINELGTVTGGATGDQTGKEIYVHSYYDYPWTYLLRPDCTGLVISTPTIPGDIVNNVIAWMMEIADNNLHGYNKNQYGDDYDDYTLLISAYEECGIDIEQAGATDRDDLGVALEKVGFFKFLYGTQPDTGLIGELKAGDILVSETGKIGLATGHNGMLILATCNELGTETGGTPGDQTGEEIQSIHYDDCLVTWEYLYRPNIAGGSVSKKDSVYQLLADTNFKQAWLNDKEKDILDNVGLGDSCKIKPCYRKNKSLLGHNLFGKKLTYLNEIYKIISVEQDGLIKLDNSDKGFYKFVNPHYILKSNE